MNKNLLDTLRAEAAPANEQLIKKAGYGRKPHRDSLIGKVSTELIDQVLKND